MTGEYWINRRVYTTETLDLKGFSATKETGVPKENNPQQMEDNSYQCLCPAKVSSRGPGQHRQCSLRVQGVGEAAGALIPGCDGDIHRRQAVYHCSMP